MSYELEGTIIQISETAKVSSNFQKREFVVETSEQYPQKIKMELIQEKCGILDTKRVGDQVKIFFNLRGSEWQGKFFTNLQAWRVENISYNPKTKEEVSSEDEDEYAGGYDDEEDQLPF